LLLRSTFSIKWRTQVWNVASTRSERRHLNRNNANSIIEVVSEVRRRPFVKGRDLVAATTRTSTAISSKPPTRRIPRSCKTRSSFTPAFAGVSLADLVEEDRSTFCRLK
jgi:hypothetical protein